MKNSTFAAAVCVIIAVGILAVVLINPQQIQDFFHDLGTWIGNIFRGGDKEKPPDVGVSLSMSEAYLGDYPEASFTVTNTGGSCTISYMAFETAPQTGTLSLGEGESRTIKATGPQVRDIGTYNTSVQITATNSHGSDSAQADTNFNVDVEPFDAMSYVDSGELSDARNGVMRLLREAWRRLQSWLSRFKADAYTQFVTPNSQTVKAIANELISRHPNDRELQAKELYYWTANWISYDYVNKDDWALQATWPIETIADKTGICVNYSVTLASLYESVGFDVKLLIVWDGGGHALILLYLPRHPEYHEPFSDGWISLDATEGGRFGQRYHKYYDHSDIADV